MTTPTGGSVRCQSKFVAWIDGHAHVVRCQKDPGHIEAGDEFHNHEQRWMDGEAVGQTANPTVCNSCGSSDISWDPADGWCCRGCGRTDADENGITTAQLGRSES